MSETFYLIPKPGRQVRDPVSAAPLPPDGAEKPKTGYWLRRVLEGDVTEGSAPAPAKASAPAATKTKPTVKE